MSVFQVHVFTCRTDNFGVLVHHPASGATASIDAPEEAPILEALAAKRWDLTHILTTHHHPDHVEANLALKRRYHAQIYGPVAERAKIPGLDHPVGDGDRFEFAGEAVEVIETPGHTAGHICYHFPEHGLLFAADTLFALGCGRLFERPASDMWVSLQKLMALPDDTEVYFGHEYTLSNARFAVTVDPDNEALLARFEEIESLRAQGRMTVPTTIGVEKETNPFLRPHDAGIRAVLEMEDASDAEVFAEIRRRKDNF
ncbi:hydroxyacylglutathione hydrolase [Ensifer soli]|uniref:hydroxyacylglutathione hydrolase n=1 Tax=Ciceribacter sp. sgz301302 TaxID=3342379 RepID=UPI0035B866F1